MPWTPWICPPSVVRVANHPTVPPQPTRLLPLRRVGWLWTDMPCERSGWEINCSAGPIFIFRAEIPSSDACKQSDGWERSCPISFILIGCAICQDNPLFVRWGISRQPRHDSNLLLLLFLCCWPKIGHHYLWVTVSYPPPHCVTSSSEVQSKMTRVRKRHTVLLLLSIILITVMFNIRLLFHKILCRCLLDRRKRGDPTQRRLHKGHRGTRAPCWMPGSK